MDPDVIQFIFKPCYLLLESETHKTCGHGHSAKYLSKSQLRKALTISDSALYVAEIIALYMKFFQLFVFLLTCQLIFGKHGNSLGKTHTPVILICN